MTLMRNARPLCLIAAMFVAASSLSASAQAPQAGLPPTPVTVVTLKQEDVTITAMLPGRVVASGVAEVRPQVNGIINERLFEEGSKVKEGDALYRIDPATYEAQVAAAEASVAQAQVALDNAQRKVDRQDELRARNVISEQAMEEVTSTRDAAEAALKVAKAQLLSARIDLDRTTIRAQLTGTIGRSLTTQGALVTSGQTTPLAVIRKLDPVYVDVAQSAADLIRWKRSGLSGIATPDQTRVKLTLADRTLYDQEGELTAAEPHVSEQTGVVTLRMEFPNPQELLLPGMYVQAEMPQGVVAGAVLVPQEGVSRDRRGNPTALVVNAENVVEQRVITIEGDRGSNWIVSAGLKAGDRVIVEGLQKIAVGATVAPEERQPAPTQPDPAQN